MHAYALLRWGLFVVFGLLGGWIIVMNFAIAYRWYARGERHSSVPLVGGFLAFFGMGACPMQQVQRFAWVPLVVDVGLVLVNLTLGLGGMMLRRFSGRE